MTITDLSIPSLLSREPVAALHVSQGPKLFLSVDVGCAVRVAWAMCPLVGSACLDPWYPTQTRQGDVRDVTIQPPFTHCVAVIGGDHDLLGVHVVQKEFDLVQHLAQVVEIFPPDGVPVDSATLEPVPMSPLGWAPNRSTSFRLQISGAGMNGQCGCM